MNYQKIELNAVPEYFYVRLNELVRNELIRQLNDKFGSKKNLAKILKVNSQTFVRWTLGSRFMPLCSLKKICELLDYNLKLAEKYPLELKGGRYCRDWIEIKFPFIIDESWAYFSQLFNTDGHIPADRKSLVIVSSNVELLNAIKKFCESLGIRKSVYECDHNGNTMLVICNKTFTNILIEFVGIRSGRKADKLLLSERILESPTSVKAAALRGAFDGDGWVCVRIRQIGIALISKNYIEQIAQILRNDFSVKCKTYGPRNKKYSCEILGIFNLVKFQKKINFLHSKRRKALEETLKQAKQTYKKRFHPNHAVFEVLKAIKNNENCDSKCIGKTLNRAEGSIRQILSQIRKKELVNFIISNRIYRYTINSKGLSFLETFK